MAFTISNVIARHVMVAACCDMAHFGHEGAVPAILADSAVIQVINNGEIKAGGFVSAGPAGNLKPHARRAFIAAYKRRRDQDVTHPVFGYRVSMRHLLGLQARLLAHHLQGKIDDYPRDLVR